MRTDTPQRIYLKDYRPPDYLIDRVELDISLHPSATRVHSRLHVRRNPQAGAGSPSLILDGDYQQLISISIDGIALSDKAYVLGGETLTLHAVPGRDFIVEIESINDPSDNGELSGLYLSNDVFCTQCEAEGFRRITYFLDRPDILSVYTVRLEANRETCPVLLSNGNKVEQGLLDNGRHYAVWHDPFPKPSYLFALVGGKLGHVADTFITSSGRKVDLGIYVEPGKEERCAYAMDALKRSMRWDEERFGCEYDLDVFNIVAVSDFNAGAMENKGLNIFNDKFVLASHDTATDSDFANVESIIAHEYFHNWTGNRITCRDWFQLCLKEGLTVYRDQEFSADMRSASVVRIGDVKQLRALQFLEDAGPLAHPVRPGSFIEINNFYTPTVYEKGAELVRMIATILGEDGFRAGMDLYLSRHDGEAATVEQFITCFEAASSVDLKQFRLWYDQAGTPTLNVQDHYDAATQTYRLDIEQTVPATPGQPDKAPMYIPIRIGLLDADGRDLPLGRNSDVLHLSEQRQSFTFKNIPVRPVPSLLRGFSAPVKLASDARDTDLAFRLTHDSDPFNRWQAGQSLAIRLLRQAYADILDRRGPSFPESFAEALGTNLADARLETAYRALLMELPSELDLILDIAHDIDTDAVHRARQGMRHWLAVNLQEILQDLYATQTQHGPYSPDAEHAGQRALRNGAMTLLSATGDAAAVERLVTHFDQADNMTDLMAALSSITHLDHPKRADLLDRFCTRFADNPLVVDKWFALQAATSLPDALDHVCQLISHPAFSLRNPNRVRALIGTFAQANHAGFNRADGAGYRFTAEMILSIDKSNGQLAARLAGAFKNWRMMDQQRRTHAQANLEMMAGRESLSRNLREIVELSLQPSHENS